MSLLKKLAVTATVISTLLTPSFAKSQEKINPFIQPNATTTIYYGSGDVNRDGEVNTLDYLLMAGSQIQNDMADSDGDGIASTENDATILRDHLENQTPLPGQWYDLSKQEKKEWVDKMMAIDKTDALLGIPDVWDCQEFSFQTSMNFTGHEGFIPEKYNTTNLQRFNLPLFITYVKNKDKGSEHAFNAILIGSNPLEWDDWYFIEPQDDKQVKPEGWNLDMNSEVEIRKLNKFFTTGGYKPHKLVKFELTNGIPELTWYADNLVLTKEGTPTSVTDESITARDFSLNQNYPNPFNPRTKIGYILQNPEQVSLKVYNIKGQELETLVDEFQTPGKYTFEFDASKYASGIYFYRLNTGDSVDTKKMIYVK